MSRFTLCLVLLALAACNSDSNGVRNAPWRTETRSVGDTTFVRTSEVQPQGAIVQLVRDWTIGSPDGAGNYSFGAIKEFAVGPSNDVFIFDQQFVQLRQYDSAGRFVRIIGARGTGPGEYERVNGIAVHDDGRLVIWNATNAGINVYSAAMQPVDSWKVPGSANFNTSGAIMVDSAGNTYIRTRVGDPPATDNMALSGRMFGITGLLRYDSAGTVKDSLRPNEMIVEVPRLVASVENNTSMSNVPFSPQFFWTFSRHGSWVSGRSDIYAIEIASLDGKVTRIEMEAERTAVTAAEREENELVMTANMRSTDPNWKWNGAPIPEVKPYFKQITVARDGRIWVSLSQSSEQIPEAELPEPRIVNDKPVPIRKLREPVVYDVFEADGSYFGRVPLPARSRWAAANGSYVWAVTRDSLDIEQITRLSLIRSSER